MKTYVVKDLLAKKKKKSSYGGGAGFFNYAHNAQTEAITESEVALVEVALVMERLDELMRFMRVRGAFV